MKNVWSISCLLQPVAVAMSVQLEPDIETLVRSPGVGVRTAPYVTLFNGSQSVIGAHYYVGRFTLYLFFFTGFGKMNILQ